LTPAGKRGKRETPQAATPRRLPSLPAESKCLERKSTGKLYSLKTSFYVIKKRLQKVRKTDFLDNPIYK
jgi:hypothetical protein